MGKIARDIHQRRPSSTSLGKRELSLVVTFVLVLTVLKARLIHSVDIEVSDSFISKNFSTERLHSPCKA